VTTSGDDGFVIEGERNGIPNTVRAHWMAVAHATAFEINTGMAMSNRGSVVAACNRITGATARTKKAALKALVLHMKQDFGYEPTGSVSRALGLNPTPPADRRVVSIGLRIENRYPAIGDEPIVTTVERVQVPPPPTDETALHEWEQTHILPHTGTGRTKGDSFYDVEVTASSHPDIIPVGTTYEFGY